MVKSHFIKQKLGYLILGLSLLAGLVLARVSIEYRADTLTHVFKTQNFDSIFGYDLLKVGSSLNNMRAQANWKCVKATFRDSDFFNYGPGECKANFLNVKNKIFDQNNPSMQIEFIYEFSTSEKIALTSFILVYLFLIILMGKNSKKQAREDEKHKLSLHMQQSLSELNQAIELKNQARRIAHDIRSPLEALKMFTRNNHEKNIQDLIERIDGIAQSLLRPQEKEKVSMANPSKIVQQIVDEKKGNISKLEIEILSTLQNNILVSMGEINLGRIISNLINNSIEALSKSKAPKIIFKIEEIHNQCQITIQDNGTGMSEQTLEKIKAGKFTAKKSGNGIGLSSAISLVEQMKGKIEIESKLNVGTSLKLLLPIAFKENEQTIVHLEDDKYIRLAWAQEARKAGKDLRSFSSYDELKSELSDIPKEAIFYIDQELGPNELLGVDVINQLSAQGFSNFFLSTGYDFLEFDSSIITGLVSKSAPFSLAH